jgi:hypothetical protein
MSRNRSANSNSQGQNRRNPQAVNPEVNPSPAKVLREELEAMSDEELDAKYEDVFGFKDEREFEREQVINSIIEALPKPPATAKILKGPADPKGTKFAKSKNGKEWKITPDMKGLIVVRQVVVQELNGGMVEVPNTETLQTYTPEKFDELNEAGFFEESLIKIEVLQEA